MFEHRTAQKSRGIYYFILLIIDAVIVFATQDVAGIIRRDPGILSDLVVYPAAVLAWLIILLGTRGSRVRRREIL